MVGIYWVVAGAIQLISAAPAFPKFAELSSIAKLVVSGSIAIAATSVLGGFLLVMRRKIGVALIAIVVTVGIGHIAWVYSQVASPNFSIAFRIETAFSISTLFYVGLLARKGHLN